MVWFLDFAMDYDMSKSEVDYLDFAHQRSMRAGSSHFDRGHNNAPELLTFDLKQVLTGIIQGALLTHFSLFTPFSLPIKLRNNLWLNQR